MAAGQSAGAFGPCIWSVTQRVNQDKENLKGKERGVAGVEMGGREGQRSSL